MGKKKKKDLASDELVINTEQDWENLKNQPGIVVLDVYTKWAGPCHVMKPVFNKIKNAVSMFCVKTKIFVRFYVDDPSRKSRYLNIHNCMLRLHSFPCTFQIKLHASFSACFCW